MLGARKVSKYAWRRAASFVNNKNNITEELSKIINNSGPEVSIESVFEKAEEAEYRKNYPLAVLYYEKIIDIWGGSKDLWLRIAILQRDMGRFEHSETSFLNALHMSSSDARIYFEMGELYQRQNRYKEAEANFCQAAQIQPDWASPREASATLEEIIELDKKQALSDETEKLEKAKELDSMEQRGADKRISPALFQPTRLESTHNYRPAFVTTFCGVPQRTRWGFGPVVRGCGSLRGYVRSIIPYYKIEIYIDGKLIHEGDLTVGSMPDEQSDVRLKKYAFNAWIDFSKFTYGWHDVIFRAISLNGDVQEEIDWKKESIIVDVPLPDGFFEEAMARVPALDPCSPLSIVDQINTLPSVVSKASPKSYPGPIRNVAILRLDGLGDVAVSVPFFLKLKELLPEAKLVVLATTDNADGCRALDLFDEVIEIKFPEDPFVQGRFLSEEQQKDLIERLSGYEFDLAITGMVSDAPRRLSIMTGAPVTIGFDGGDLKSLSIFYHTQDSKSGGNILNYAARYEMLTKALEVWLDSGARVQKRNDLSRDLLIQYGIKLEEDYVVMHTGSRIKATEWFGYAELADRIVKKLGLKVVYIANDETQKSLLSESNLKEGKIIYLSGNMPFDHFDAVLSYCSVFLGNDSGPGHLATLRGAKAIRIISARSGGSEWKSELAGVCIFRRVPCAGCGAIPISTPEECAHDIACVKNITIDEVYDQVTRLLSEGGSTSEAGPSLTSVAFTGEIAS
ncbi:glycosyltransferase family 9 (heptosyltransferase) [Komagataeibacter europaeus]|uniref:Glycosyltransferase family 9 (Heptosyltransferase) n=1 Tax=Komagataeibacter europaeus TaxID=33995 RepID=A0A0M0EG53_KOMEU|nr:glycosyltransferase family 9 protein [Komagataeibacter europaeus]KON64244.1 glycosyltransferase family 9 (heptosyltransferase) [Komagataeibacter europaeus]